MGVRSLYDKAIVFQIIEINMGIDVLLKIIREAIKSVPSLKYAFGVLAIVSIVAIISATQLDYRIALFGAIFVLLMSVIVLLFSRLSSLEGGHFKIPAIFFLWFSLTITIVLSCLLISSIFFKQPLDLSFYLTEEITTEQVRNDIDESIKDENTTINPESNENQTNNPVYLKFEKEKFGRAEFIERWNDKLIAGFSIPNQLIFFENISLDLYQRISLNGSPKHIKVDDRYAYVSTEFPNSIHIIDLLSKEVKSSFLIPTDKELFPSLKEIIDGQLPIEIHSMTLLNNNIWIIVSDNSNAVIYRLNLLNGKFEIPEYYDYEIAFDARGWKLESIGQSIFAIETDSIPSGIHLLSFDGYIKFGGHDYDLVSSATNIWSSSNQAVSFISPKNNIVGVNITRNVITPVANYGSLGDIGAVNWIDPIVKIDGDKLFIAVNESTMPGQKMLWSTLLKFENNIKNEISMFIDSKIIDIDTFQNRIFTIVEDSQRERKLAYIDL